MPYIGDPKSKSEEDETQSKSVDVATLGKALAKRMDEVCSISRKSESAILTDVNKLAAIVGPQYAYNKLSEEMLQTGRMVEKLFSSPSVRYADILSHLDHAAPFGSWGAAQQFMQGFPKHFLDLQHSFRSQVENCKSICDSAFASLLSDRYTLTNSISALQKAWDISGVTRDLFLESYSKAIQTISENNFLLKV